MLERQREFVLLGLPLVGVGDEIGKPSRGHVIHAVGIEKNLARIPQPVVVGVVPGPPLLGLHVLVRTENLGVDQPAVVESTPSTFDDRFSVSEHVKRAVEPWSHRVQMGNCTAA